MTTAALQKDGVLDTLRCAICNCYLSISPISIISKDGQNQKCGRCKDVISEINQRNLSFENLMKLLTFPCIFTNCKETIAWGEVEEHEKLCSYKTIKCPLFGVCKSDLRVSEVIAHFEGQHKDSVFYETYKNTEFDNNTKALLIKNNMTFLLYHGVNKFDNKRPNTIICCLYSLMPGLSYKYRIGIIPKHQNKLSLFYEDHVCLFDERKHCLVCIEGQCTEKHHKFAETDNARGCNGGIIIDPQALRASFNAVVFKYSLTLINQQESRKRKNSTVSGENSYSHEKLIKKAVQCPICLKYMGAPVYSCQTGHLLCTVCRGKLSNCPTCQAKFEDSRCYAIEEMAEKAQLSCEQCSFIGNVHELRRHYAEKN